MSVDCQFCGTSVILPESGAIVLSNKTKESTFHLPVHHEDENAIIHNYDSHSQLLDSLHSLLQNNNSNQWVHVINKESRQSFPISIDHLYERLKQPELTSIIHNGDFTSHLQPIVDISNNDIYGYESLLRTKEREVNPGELFSLAHRTGLHSMLDQKARRSAVQAKSKLIPTGQKIFINFLPSTIYVPEYCLKHTFQIVEEFNIDPADLVFEVVETEKITDVNHLKSIFDTYKSSGMKVALDDVGTGYSTLEMLSLLQPDFVKIDRSYIQNCHRISSHQDFLHEVMARADQFNIKVLAEGIETKEEWEWLQSIGVHYGQGYYLGRPQETPKKEIILPS
ncbi:EAL domain-containing protein [Halobacillus seohaensis]|uniref:EAL domain-containing protein n=1 Tax=Halobacillus seohaensis TaxID=447421 RepID=A0ABW2EM50_9BACI